MTDVINAAPGDDGAGPRRGNVSRDRATKFVQASVRVIKAGLIDRLKMDEAEAEEMARNFVHDICVESGGGYMYIPRDLEFDLTKRDRAIFEEFHGRNLHQLVTKYGVTHTRIYQIVAQVKRELLAQRQGRLPGLEDA